MQMYAWVLTPDYIKDIENYDCGDDRSITSTFFIDEILEFLRDHNIQTIDYTLSDRFQYKFIFQMEKGAFCHLFHELIAFETGRFETSGIFVKNNKNTWIKIWKKGMESLV